MIAVKINIFYKTILFNSPKIHVSSTIARVPAIGLIKWSRPKGLKVCSYVKKSVLNSKIDVLQKSAGTQMCYGSHNTPGRGYFSK